MVFVDTIPCDLRGAWPSLTFFRVGGGVKASIPVMQAIYVKASVCDAL